MLELSQQRQEERASVAIVRLHSISSSVRRAITCYHTYLQCRRHERVNRADAGPPLG